MITAERAEQWFGGPSCQFSLVLTKGLIEGRVSLHSLGRQVANDRLTRFQGEAFEEDARLFFGASERAFRLARIAHERDVHLFALGGADELDIADFCDVGVAINRNSAEAWRSLLEHNHGPGDWSAIANRLADHPPEKARANMRNFLGRVFRRAPYRIDFADPKGLRAHFLGEVDEQTAEWLERQIAKIDIEAFDLADPLSMKEFIIRDRQLVLWWD